MDKSIADVKPSEDWRLRRDLETVVVGTHGRGTADSLHLPADDGTPRCQTQLRRTDTHIDERAAEWKEKEMSVYPAGHKEFCERCVQIWREA